MPHILCAGMAVLDEVFHVREFPAPDTKAEATEFFAVGGGNAANAAVAIARLGARVAFAGPIGGPAGEDAIGDRVIKASPRRASTAAAACALPGARTPISAILLNAQGERTIANYRDKRLDRGDAGRSRPPRRGHRRAAGGQPLPRLRDADLPRGAPARTCRRDRRRQGDGRNRSAVRARNAMSSSPATACAGPPGSTTSPPGSRAWRSSPMPSSRRPTAHRRCCGGRARRSGSCRCSRSRRSTRSPPAMSSTAPSR